MLVPQVKYPGRGRRRRQVRIMKVNESCPGMVRRFATMPFIWRNRLLFSLH